VGEPVAVSVGSAGGVVAVSEDVAVADGAVVVVVSGGAVVVLLGLSV
jgi:hypothetical protein